MVIFSHNRQAFTNINGERHKTIKLRVSLTVIVKLRLSSDLIIRLKWFGEEKDPGDRQQNNSMKSIKRHTSEQETAC